MVMVQHTAYISEGIWDAIAHVEYVSDAKLLQSLVVVGYVL